MICGERVFESIAKDLMNAKLGESPVKVWILVWHDDVAAQKMMNNMPGYYGRLYPAIGTGTCGFYSDAHRRYNEHWFESHMFRDPRRERIYHNEEGKVRKLAEPGMPNKDDIAYGYRLSECGKRQEELIPLQVDRKPDSPVV